MGLHSSGGPRTVYFSRLHTSSTGTSVLRRPTERRRPRATNGSFGFAAKRYGWPAMANVGDRNRDWVRPSSFGRPA